MKSIYIFLLIIATVIWIYFVLNAFGNDDLRRYELLGNPSYLISGITKAAIDTIFYSSIFVVIGILLIRGIKGHPFDKKCPDCCERVRWEVKICKHCRHRFETEEIIWINKPKKRWWSN